MSITATEFKTNLGKYLMLAATEDIFISNPNQDRVDIAKSLFGSVPSGCTLEEAQKERLDQI